MGMNEGTNGSIRISEYPITNSEEIGEYQIHSMGIMRMKLNLEENHLFTIGRDGILVVMELKERVAKKE